MGFFDKIKDAMKFDGTKSGSEQESAGWPEVQGKMHEWMMRSVWERSWSGWSPSRSAISRRSRTAPGCGTKN